MDEWIKQKERQRMAAIRPEWQDIIGHDREWWRREAERTRTDWNSLLRQRTKARAYAKAGRPPLAAWLKSLAEAVDEPGGSGQGGGA